MRIAAIARSSICLSISLKAVFLSSLMILGIAKHVQAASIVDTGPGGTVGGYSLWSKQWLGGQFSVASPTTVTGIDGWISTYYQDLNTSSFLGGTAFVNIYSNNASSLPGTQLFRQEFTIPYATAANWQGVSGISLNLTPGTYWATFEAPAGSALQALMPYGVQNPLSAYAFSSAYPYSTGPIFGPYVTNPAGSWTSLNGSIGIKIEEGTGSSPPSSAVPSTLQLAQFSDAAYGSSTAVAGYSEISLGTFSSLQQSGFAAKAFVNNTGDRIVLSFAGTDDVLDTIGADSAFLKSQPTDTLKSYVSYATTVVQFLATRYPGVEITFTGHSLGGAIAQILADATGSNATTFNAPGAKQFSFSTELSLLPVIPKPSSTQIIANYRVYGDLVSTVGTQYGSTVIFTPPISTILIDGASLLYAKTMHSLQTVTERIVNNAPTTLSVGPTAYSAMADLIVTGVINGGVGVAIEAAVVYGVNKWIDPENLDLYWLRRNADSPNFRSVTFPYTLDQHDLFRLELYKNDTWTLIGLFDEATTFDFGSVGVDQFRFFVLDAQSFLAPAFVEPFTFGVSFVSDGYFRGTLTAYSSSDSTSIPEPGTLILFGIALACLGFTYRQKEAR